MSFIKRNRKGTTTACPYESNSLCEAPAHGLRRDKPARFSTNFQRDEKSFRPWILARPCPEIPNTREYARAWDRERERENFWFQFSGLWPYRLLSFSSGNGDISREQPREEKEAYLLDGFCDSSHFHKTEFIIGVTSPAHLVRASSRRRLFIPRKIIASANSDFSAYVRNRWFDWNLITIIWKQF